MGQAISMTITQIQTNPKVGINTKVHTDQRYSLTQQNSEHLKVLSNEIDPVGDDLENSGITETTEFNDTSDIESELRYRRLAEDRIHPIHTRQSLIEQCDIKLLSEKARSAVRCLMYYGCSLQIFPYGWDSINFKITKNTRIQNWFFNFHSICMFVSYSFVTFRCISTINEKMPDRVRMMNIVWVVAFGLSSSSTIQFYKRRDDIMGFANALFRLLEIQHEAIRMEVYNSCQQDETKRSKVSNWSSRIVLISAFLLYTSGPAHAMVLWYGPCTPTYISSVIHNCTTYMDMPLSVLEATPYVIWEYYIIGFVLAVWSFNWTLIFMGWLWIKDNLKKVREDFDYAEQQYRYCQVFAALLNNAFAFYLRAFPSVLFLIAGMMLFGTIRYTHLPFYLYVVFPSCGVRCFFEALTALGAAGMLNYESIQFLNYLGKRIDSFREENTRKCKTAFHKSCRPILCTAGSMYTFENSIVLVSLYHCTQLTFNMLVTCD